MSVMGRHILPPVQEAIDVINAGGQEIYEFWSDRPEWLRGRVYDYYKRRNRYISTTKDENRVYFWWRPCIK